MFKKLLGSETAENIGAFVSGDLLATIVAMNLLTDVAKPMILATMTGVLGGFFALLGKDLYKWLKSKIYKDAEQYKK